MHLSHTPLAPGHAEITFGQHHLDATSAKTFRAAMEATLKEHHVLLLDMSTLHFIDSAGLGALLALLRGINNKGGQLHLHSIRAPVMALLELVRMHRLFSIFDTREAALECIACQPAG